MCYRAHGGGGGLRAAPLDQHVDVGQRRAPRTQAAQQLLHASGIRDRGQGHWRQVPLPVHRSVTYSLRAAAVAMYTYLTVQIHR